MARLRISSDVSFGPKPDLIVRCFDARFRLGCPRSGQSGYFPPFVVQWDTSSDSGSCKRPAVAADHAASWVMMSRLPLEPRCKRQKHKSRKGRTEWIERKGVNGNGPIRKGRKGKGKRRCWRRRIFFLPAYRPPNCDFSAERIITAKNCPSERRYRMGKMWVGLSRMGYYRIISI